MDATTLYRIALGKDRQPDSWQRALASGAWPRVLVAPTGSGKTAAVTLGWAAHRLRSPDTTPRRLVWCLPMRTLVEQTARAVAGWFGSLAAADADARNRLPGPQDVHVLMGGVDADGWLDRPERPAVLVGTQDMLLSRALMRGYASSRAVWPMEFALLHEDAQWVFDEVQLMGAGRATSAQLEAFRQADADRARREDRPAGKPSRSLWVSATLDPRWLATVDHPAPSDAAVVRIDPATAPDGRLARLAHAAKRLSRSPVSPASSKKNDLADYIARLADAILDAHSPGHMTLAIVNRVDRAQALRAALDKRLSKRLPTAPTLALVHSRFRPADRAREMDKVIDADDASPHGRIVVATQAVEAGADISAAVLFTELAPWSSLVQRFGRANRYAELPDGADVRWIDLMPPAAEDAATDKNASELARPYEVAELQAARDRLAGLSDVAPVRLPPPDDLEPPRRVIRRKDLDDLFDTDPDLTGFDVDVSPYVRDAEDTDIRVFWRNPSAAGDEPPRPGRPSVGDTTPGPPAPEARDELPHLGRPSVRDTRLGSPAPETRDEPPRPGRDELCAVSIAAANKWIEKLPNRGRGLLFQRDPQWRRRDARTGASPPGWMPLPPQGRPWPGLVLLADPQAGGYSGACGFTGDPKDVPEPISGPAASASPGGVAGRGGVDAPREGDGAGGRAGGGASPGGVAGRGGVDAPREAEGHDEHQASGVADHADGSAPQEADGHDEDPMSGGEDHADRSAPREAEDHDEDPMSGIDRVVPLADHLRDVADEADSLCAALDVVPGARATVVRAARWHDLGKAHEVFQDTMRRGLDGRTAAPEVLLAKTVKRARHARAYFRHELASALALLAHEHWSRDADLAAYLIAAHHGKVRMNLRALPREAAPKDPDRAGSRFARGVWEGDELPPFDLEGDERWQGGGLSLSIMELGWDEVSRESWTERTRELLARLGPFRLAWLETLLRVADWRASAKERDGGRNEG